MKELYKALADFQQEVTPIYKGTEGYGYSYADWGQILEIVNPLMQKHGLGFTQPLDGTRLKTIVFHIESGESIEGSVEIPQDISLAKMNAFQVIGSGITYYRRYSLSAMLGLVTDKDADAAGEQVKTKDKTVQVLDPKGSGQTRTTIIRDRAEEQKEAEDEELARAKIAINDELKKHDYITVDSKRTFIKGVLEKATIDNLGDADAVMDALEDEN
jgi:hypothetical protein